MRGEYACLRLSCARMLELPPRARRIRFKPSSPSALMGNYLRVRGEYLMGEIRNQEDLELPPRARRILIQAIEQPFDCGTTSACAENTPRSHTRRGPSWNYLRVRGEYATSGFEEFWAAELPPRARRILLNASLWGWLMGTTSACAENTTWRCCCCWWCWNYLRVRGEYGLCG